MNRCTLAGNSATLYGGGIETAGSLTVNQSTLTANTCGSNGGGAIDRDTGALTVNQCTISAGGITSVPLCALQVVVASPGTGDSETITLNGTAPYFSGTLTLSTIAGRGANNGVLLVDTYDTLEGVRNAIEAGKRLRERGHELIGVPTGLRLDAELDGAHRSVREATGQPEREHQDAGVDQFVFELVA